VMRYEFLMIFKKNLSLIIHNLSLTNNINKLLTFMKNYFDFSSLSKNMASKTIP
jgi:hypothetical protein